VHVKQIIVMGDYNRWQQEADFTADILHMAATRVIAVNIGPRNLKVDLNLRDLRRLFPGKTGPESIKAAVKKLYSQGIADGILCFIDAEPNLFAVADAAFAALPFGLPKVAVTPGNSPWRGSWEIIRFNLPGQEYNLNPVVKICLSNAAFAVGGMALSNIYNFGSAQPTIVACCGQQAGKGMAGLGINFLSLASEDYLPALMGNGYVDGLILSRECKSMVSWVEIASARGIPVVLVCKNPCSIYATLKALTPPATPVLIVSPSGAKPQAAEAPPSPAWPPLQPVPYKYGTRPFYWHAAQTLLRLLR
jgi:hypothetical protein